MMLHADFWKPVTKIRDVGRLLNPADEAVKWLQTPADERPLYATASPQFVLVGLFMDCKCENQDKMIKTEHTLVPYSLELTPPSIITPPLTFW